MVYRLQDIPLNLRFFDGRCLVNVCIYESQATMASMPLTTFPILQLDRYIMSAILTRVILRRLWVWMTRELTSFSGNSSVNIGNFDIANIELLLAPSPAQKYPYPTLSNGTRGWRLWLIAMSSTCSIRLTAVPIITLFRRWDMSAATRLAISHPVLCMNMIMPGTFGYTAQMGEPVFRTGLT